LFTPFFLFGHLISLLAKYLTVRVDGSSKG
jgi:hypothetical protein